jgi:hypothetical protein
VIQDDGIGSAEGMRSRAGRSAFLSGLTSRSGVEANRIVGNTVTHPIV